MRRTGLIVLLFTSMIAACGQEAEPGAGSEAGPPPAEASPAVEEPGPECVETDELAAVDNDWDPGCIVTSGSVTITNEDQAPHNFTITGAVEAPLPGGKTATVDVSEAAEPSGETYFLCTIHPGMDGFLWVQ